MAALALAAAAATTSGATAHAGVQVGTSGWQWGSPQPQGNTLNALAFQGGGVGYAAGQAGTLLKTTDGGSTWAGLRSGTTTPLVDVQLVGANTVIAGGGCVARRSDDGGQTFKRIPFTPVESSCPSDLAAFSFVDPQVGFLVLADGSVLQTADGGQEFTPRTALPGSKATGGAALPTAVSFTSATRGIAALSDGRLLLTTDAGVSWTPVVAGGGAIRDLLFLSPTQGYAVGAGSTFLRTADGGQTWTPASLGIPPLDLSDLSCADATRCVASTAGGGPIVRISITPPAAAPVPTPVTPADPGTSTTPTTPADTTTTTTAPATPAPDTVSAAVVTPATLPVFAAAFASPTRIAAVGTDGTTVVSDDAGQTFAAADARLVGSYSRLRLGSDPRTAYALGDRGSLAVTTNAGQTWQRTAVPTSADLLDVGFASATTGYALDEAGGLFRTSTSGATWQPLDTGTTDEPSAVAATLGAVLLVGPRGVRRSTDDGGTFDAVTASAVRRARLFGIDRAEGSVVVYGAKALVRSADAGRTWRAIRLPTEIRRKRSRIDVSRVDFVSGSTGYLTTDAGKLWRTANGGRSWTELPGVGTSDLNGLAFSSATSGFVLRSSFGDFDRYGVALHTSDGGRTWQPQLVTPAVAQSVLAAPGVSYLLDGPTSLLASTTGGSAGSASTLTLSSSRRTLRKPGRVTVSGRLQPAAGNERVTVSSRAPGSSRWQEQTVRTAANGSFTTSWSVRRGTTRFVAQWAGDVRSAGDGSTVLSVAVKAKAKR